MVYNPYNYINGFFFKDTKLMCQRVTRRFEVEMITTIKFNLGDWMCF